MEVIIMVCTTITIADLFSISNISIELYPAADDAINNLWGVLLKTTCVGNGTVTINWGSFEIEKLSFVDGMNMIANSLPPGTHEVCVVA